MSVQVPALVPGSSMLASAVQVLQLAVEVEAVEEACYHKISCDAHFRLVKYLPEEVEQPQVQVRAHIQAQVQAHIQAQVQARIRVQVQAAEP